MFRELEPLLSVIEKNEKSYDIEKIKKSFEYAKSLHEGQFRLSGEPYISHPVSVAVIVAELGLDTDSICAALLHDTVEDCSEKTSLEIISKMFGKEVSENVAILYGGSVTSSVAESFISKENIDGFLVGGASLKPEELQTFLDIMKQ